MKKDETQAENGVGKFHQLSSDMKRIETRFGL